MAAVSSVRRSRPPVSRVRVRVVDSATTLALSLASARAAFRLDVIALLDLDGTLLASAGDRRAAEDLASLASRAAREPRAHRASVLPRLGVIVETLEKDSATWILAATAADPKRDVRGMIEMIHDALPGGAAANDEVESDDFESALDKAFSEDWGEDPLAGLGSIVG
jgi:hypothetical protein